MCVCVSVWVDGVGGGGSVCVCVCVCVCFKVSQECESRLSVRAVAAGLPSPSVALL